MMNLIVIVVFFLIIYQTSENITRRQHGTLLVLIFPIALCIFLILKSFLNPLQLSDNGELTNILFNFGQMSESETFRNSYGSMIVEAVQVVSVLGFITLPFGIWKLVKNRSGEEHHTTEISLDDIELEDGDKCIGFSISKDMRGKKINVDGYKMDVPPKAKVGQQFIVNGAGYRSKRTGKKGDLVFVITKIE